MRRVVYRAAVIGCGKIGSEFADDPGLSGIYTHTGAYSACPDTELVACCDRDAEKLETCGRKWGVTALYGDTKRLLAEQKPDIVSICTPDETHHALFIETLESPSVKAVLMEKPLTTSLDHAVEIASLAEQQHIVVAVNYGRRYADCFTRLQEYLRTGAVGEIQSVSGFYSKGTIHNGTHWLDAARFLIGDIVMVQGWDVRREKGPDPTLDAVLRFACGAGGHLVGCDSDAFAIFEMDIVGKKGRVRITKSGHQFDVYDASNEPRGKSLKLLPAEKTSLLGGMQDMTLHAVEDLVWCLKSSGRQPRCSVGDGISALKAALAIVASAKSGSAVALV